MEKRCFCVHNTSLKNSDSLSFMFVPLPVEDGRKFSSAVLVLGAIITNESELHNHLLFLDHIRRAVYIPFLSLNSFQDKANLMQGLDVVMAENQILKKKNKFERSVVQVLANNSQALSIICTNTNGLITYISPAAEQLLGYASSELVGLHNVIKLHEPNEIIRRSKELESELGKSVVPGVGVIVEKTMRNRGREDTRPWLFVKKDGSFVNVNVTVKPLHDEKSIFGFVEIVSDQQTNTQASPLNLSNFQSAMTGNMPHTPSVTTTTDLDYFLSDPSSKLQFNVASPAMGNLNPKSPSVPQQPNNSREEELIKSILEDNNNFEDLFLFGNNTPNNNQ